MFLPMLRLLSSSRLAFSKYLRPDGEHSSSRSTQVSAGEFHANFLAISSKLLGSNTTCDPV